MSHIGLERIELLFQTWPESFKRNYKRELTKDEIIKSIEDRQKELEQQEIKRKFDSFNSEDLELAKKFLNEKEIDYILTEVAKPKYKIIEENIHKQQDFLDKHLGIGPVLIKYEAEESKVKSNNKSKKSK